MQMMLEEVYPCMLHSKDCKGFEDSEDSEDSERFEKPSDRV